MEAPDEIIDFVIRHLTVDNDFPLASYQPKFLIDQVRAACKFEGIPPQFRPDLVTMALGNLFTKDTPGFRSWAEARSVARGAQRRRVDLRALQHGDFSAITPRPIEDDTDVWGHLVAAAPHRSPGLPAGRVLTSFLVGHLMAFLRNDAVNRVNLHYGIQALAQGAGGIFFLVFMLRAGVSIPAALTAQAAILAGRFVLRPAHPAACQALGPEADGHHRHACPRAALSAAGRGRGRRRLAASSLCIISAIGEVFYWPSYNAYFAASAMPSIAATRSARAKRWCRWSSIIAPLLGAWALLTLGPRPMFAAVGLVQALAVVPLIGAPNVAVKASAPGAFRAARLGAIL